MNKVKFANVKNDVAVDVVAVLPSSIFNDDYAAKFETVPDDVELGWIRDAQGVWFPPEDQDPAVPAAVAPLQGLLAIDFFGMSEAFEAWADSPSRTFAERAFISRAQTWRRNDPILQGAAEVLGLTTDQVNALFLKASTL